LWVENHGMIVLRSIGTHCAHFIDQLDFTKRSDGTLIMTSFYATHNMSLRDMLFSFNNA